MHLADVSRLSSGMTKYQVDNILGRPVRLLSTSYLQNGQVEVYEYITYRNESYAVEFWNGNLSGYDFLYENATNIRPGQTGRPSSINPPRPTRPDRPYNNNNRPSSVRPGNNNSSGRAGAESRSSSTRDEKSSTNSSTSRPSTERPNNNNNDQNQPSVNNNTGRPNVENSSTTTRNTREKATAKPRTESDNSKSE